MILIDKMCYRSGLRYMNAEVKFAYTVVTLLICIVSRSLIAAGIVLLANGILTVKRGGIPFALYVKYMLIPLAFLLMSTLALIVNISREPLDAYAILIGSWYLTSSKVSLWFALRQIGSGFASVSCLYFLALNTTMTDILGTLKKIHCPQLLLELMRLIYRFIFVLMDTASAIMTAQRVRLGYEKLRTSLHSFGEMAAALFIRAWKRSNALYDALESRGYDGELRVLEESRAADRKEIAAVIVFEISLIFVIWLAKRIGIE